MNAVRYNSRTVQLTFRESLRWLWKNGVWTRTKVVYDPVSPGETGYDQAPFETVIIWDHKLPPKIWSKFEHEP